MSICMPTGTVGPVASASAPCDVGGPGFAAPREALLPTPDAFPDDDLAALYRLFSENNREESKAAKTTVETRVADKHNQMRQREVALERARKAQEEQGGIFDSLGIGSLAGVVMASPIVVVADMSMHMARLTPDAVREFEKEHKDTIALAAKLYCAATNVSVLADGALSPDSLRAASALGGLLLSESECLGKEESDWAAAALMLGGVDGRASANVVIADKESAVADGIREVEEDTRSWNKWVAAAGMAVAGAAAIVGSWGTATAPVVAIGVALSAGGFAVTETKCFDPLLGKDASMWIGGGLTLVGALTTGAGVADAARELAAKGVDLASTSMHVARSLQVGGAVMTGAAQARQGLQSLANAATRHEVDDAQNAAHAHLLESQRLQRMVEEIIETVRDIKDRHQRMSTAVNEAVETQCQTQLMAAGMRA